MIRPGGTLLITGATGLIGSHLAEAAVAAGYRVRALVRPRPAAALAALHSDGRALLTELGAELFPGDLLEPGCAERSVAGVDAVVHCAAQVGDWGPASLYERLNIDATERLLAAARGVPSLRRFVALSSLGVYEPRDHFGTDESTPPWGRGLDPYTRSKAAAEAVLARAAAGGLPLVWLRPGFVYGARDRHVLPNLLRALKQGTFAFVGSGEQRLDNTYVKNLTAAILAALVKPGVAGEAINVTDSPLVSRLEFVGTVARLAGYPVPTRHVPRPLAKALAYTADQTARWLGATEPPFISRARYKFLALNLDFSIAKAQRLLDYQPAYSFASGMAEAVAWFRRQGAAA